MSASPRPSLVTVSVIVHSPGLLEQDVRLVVAGRRGGVERPQYIGGVAALVPGDDHDLGVGYQLGRVGVQRRDREVDRPDRRRLGPDCNDDLVPALATAEDLDRFPVRRHRKELGDDNEERRSDDDQEFYKVNARDHTGALTSTASSRFCQ